MTTEPIPLDGLERRAADRHREALRKMHELSDKLGDALIDTTNVDQAIAYHERSIRTFEGSVTIGKPE